VSIDTTSAAVKVSLESEFLFGLGTPLTRPDGNLPWTILGYFQEAVMDTSALIGGAIGILIALVLIAVLVVVFRWLWNTTMPNVFGVKELTFGQALKILILAGILFGGHRVVEVPQQVSGESTQSAAPTK
jgi:hypothetical protein